MKRLWLLILLLGGCSASGGEPAPSTPPPSASPSSASPSSAPPPGPLCAHDLGAGSPDLGTARLVLDAVVLPTRTLQVSGSGVPGELFAKNGLVVRADTEVQLSVAPGAPAGTRIGWGSPGPKGATITVPACPHAGGWAAFAGGYTVPAPACVPLLVRAGGREQRVEVAVGKAC